MWVLSPGPKIAFRNLRLLYRGDVIFAGLVIVATRCLFLPPALDLLASFVIDGSSLHEMSNQPVLS